MSTTDEAVEELSSPGLKPGSVKIATCVPKQCYDRESKLRWLREALDKTDCDLFLTPQEYLGGTYIMGEDMHMERGWLLDTVGEIARTSGKVIGFGACVQHSSGGSTEDYLYFDTSGNCLGHHRKFALPSYDDVRAKGAGNLWPEVNYRARATPIDIPELGMRVGTVFCWEVFSQTIWAAYSMAGVNFVTHPIKFDPRGWLKLTSAAKEGSRKVTGFDRAGDSTIWVDRLLMASKHEVLCPIGVSCNSWNLRKKFKALYGHVDELLRTTDLMDVPAMEEDEHIHVFTVRPAVYSALDSMHSMGAFKEKVGDIDDYRALEEWKMHIKIRRIEAHLMGGTTKFDCMLKASTLARQKSSTRKRTGKMLAAAGEGHDDV